MWHFENDKITFDLSNKSRPKSLYNPKNKDI